MLCTLSMLRFHATKLSSIVIIGRLANILHNAFHYGHTAAELHKPVGPTSHRLAMCCSWLDHECRSCHKQCSGGEPGSQGEVGPWTLYE